MVAATGVLAPNATRPAIKRVAGLNRVLLDPTMSLAGTGADINTTPTPDAFADDDESFFASDGLPSSSQTVVNHESDGFEAYDLSFEFSSKELDHVDEAIRKRGKRGGAHYFHQIEEGGAPEPLVDGQLARSPYDTFRARQRYLTVTDIAGPSWWVPSLSF